MIYPGRAHQDNHFELSYVKFLQKIKKMTDETISGINLQKNNVRKKKRIEEMSDFSYKKNNSHCNQHLWVQ